MSERLPIRRTRDFQDKFLKLISRRNRSNFIYDLEHLTKDDVEQRFPNLKGPTLRFFKSYHKSNHRTLFVYCFQCFHQFNHELDCNICDENNLERLIIIDIDHRSNAYKDNNLRNFEFI